MTEVSPGRVAQVRLRRLEAEATHARQRYELYKAKTYGPRPTEPSRLEKLRRISQQASARLDQARSER